jgi:hypothetical protein
MNIFASFIGSLLYLQMYTWNSQQNLFFAVLQFRQWKTGLETATTSSFVKHQAATRSDEHENLYFYCHRSGRQSRAESDKDVEQHNTTVSAESLPVLDAGDDGCCSCCCCCTWPAAGSSPASTSTSAGGS